MYLFRNKFVALLLVITPKSFWPMKKLSSLFSLFLLIPLFAVASEVGDRTIPAEVAQLADSLKQKLAPDKRVALFDVDYSFSGKNVMVAWCHHFGRGKDGFAGWFGKERICGNGLSASASG